MDHPTPAWRSPRFASKVVLILRAAPLCALLLGLLSPGDFVFAQGVSSSVEGIVTDPSKAVIAGAEVVLTNLNTRAASTTVSNSVGRYLFPSVSVGRYSLQVTAPGFKTFIESDFEVVVAQRVDLDVVLEVGEVTESITVEAGGLTQLLETSSNELGTLIDTQRVEALPLNGRNFLQLGLLSGATQPSGPSLSNFVVAQGGHPDRAINIGGLQQDLTIYKINGMATSGSRLGHAQQNVSVAAIDQFKVRQGFFLPGEGPDPGIVNVITRSGANRFHGEVFEFFRANDLDARNFFERESPGPFTRNQFGFALGGPIVPDRVFFFGNYEGLRQRRSAGAQAFTPTAAMFNGNFSELSEVIYDPLSFNPDSGERQPFPNNQIPSSQINSVSSSLLEFYQAGSSLQSRPFNVFGNPRTLDDSDQFTVRVDGQLTSKHTLFGQFIHEDSPVVNEALFPLSGTAFPLNSQLAMVQWTSTWSPSLVNEFRAGWTRGEIFFTGEQEAGIQDRLGITGTADQDGPPGIGIQGFSGFGRSTGLLGNIDNLYQVHEAVHHVRGNHQFQFGVDLRYMRTIQQSANANARGTINFQNVFTAQLARDDQGRLAPLTNTGSSFADFLLGTPTIGQVVSMPRTHYRWTQFEPYLRHSWKLRPDLTLNWGLSWFLGTPPDPGFLEEDGNRPHAFDFNTGKVLFAALNEIDPKVYETDKNNFAPRLGLAWHVTDDTVVRAGFGVYYASQRVLDQQFAIIAPGVSIVQSISNSQFEPTPEFVLGENVFPPVSTEPITREFADNIGGTLFDLDTGIRTGYVEQWNLSIQHSLGRRNLLEVAYLGNQAHKLNNRWNANSCSVPGSLQCDPNVIRYSQFPLILFAANEASSNYHGLNIKFNRQFAEGFSFLANYTWSKAITNGMQSGSAGTINQRATDRRADRGPAFYDIPHRFVASALWELPFGTGKRYLNAGGALNQIVGGWSVNVITTFAQGTPVTITAPNRTGAAFTFVRADRLCQGRDSLSNKNLRDNGLLYLDTSCFEAPAPGFFGNSGIGLFHGPGTSNWDIGIRKDFRFTEDVRAQFRAEFFNAWNHTQFLSPQTDDVASSTFGQIGGTAEARQIQFGLKILW